MKKKYFILGVIAVLLSSFTLLKPKKIAVLNTSLTDQQIAGVEGFTAGNLGIPFRFIHPYKPQYQLGITEEEVASQIVGHVYPESDLLGNLAVA